MDARQVTRFSVKYVHESSGAAGARPNGCGKPSIQKTQTAPRHAERGAAGFSIPAFDHIWSLLEAMTDEHLRMEKR